ncbi:MAG: Dynamin-1-like protein, variant 2 [Marteilia pararefringens]
MFYKNLKTLSGINFAEIESGAESMNGNLSSQNIEARECTESDLLGVHESSQCDKFGQDSHKEIDEVINIALEASHHAEDVPEKNRCIPEDKLYLFLDHLLDLKLLLRQHSAIIENMISKSTTLSSDMMRKLREDILNFNVPSIVAIGAQSTGKSSLLESIIRRDILPKGNGLITRCPIVINIVPHHQEKSQNEVEICQETEWAEIGQERQIIPNINDLKSAIELKMSRNYETNPNLNSTFMRGENSECSAVDQSVTHMPLKVKIFSNIMPPLCIIDLPGLIKVPNKGQPDDIEQITFRICQDYIQNPNSIILALSPATMDLQTSESLKMAEEYDPEGERTIAVITKLDLLAQDSNDPEILEKYFEAQNLKWRPKIVGCICRSKLDCPKSDDIYANNRKLEKKLMGMLDKSLQKRIGIENLVKTLHTKLNIIVHKSLNNIMQFIETLLSEMLKEYDFTALDSADKQYRLIQKIEDFSVIFERIVEGNDPSLIELNSNGKEVLRGGSAIYNILHRDFFQQISRIDSLNGITKQYLEKTILRSAGINPRLFLPENALTNLARQQLRQLQSPCFNMIDKIRNEIHKTIQMTYIQVINCLIHGYQELSTFIRKDERDHK